MKLVLIGLIVGLIIGFTLFISKKPTYTLEPYTGIGSYVYKHGSIVRMNDDGTPVVVGHFDDDSGDLYSGTMLIKGSK